MLRSQCGDHVASGKTCAPQKYWAAKNRPVASVCSAPLTIDPVRIDDGCYTLARILANEYS
jgi:hypothetical protein